MPNFGGQRAAPHEMQAITDQELEPKNNPKMVSPPEEKHLLLTEPDFVTNGTKYLLVTDLQYGFSNKTRCY